MDAGDLLEGLAEPLLKGLDATGELAFDRSEVLPEAAGQPHELPELVAGLVALAALVLQAVDGFRDALVDLRHRVLEVGVELSQLPPQVGAEVIHLALAVVQRAQRPFHAIELALGDLEDAGAELEPLVELALGGGRALAEAVGARDQVVERLARRGRFLDQFAELARELSERALVEHANVRDHGLVVPLGHTAPPRRAFLVMGQAQRHHVRPRSSSHFVSG